MWCPNIGNYDIIDIEFQKARIIILQSESFYTRTLAGKLVTDSYLARTDSENFSSTDRANTLCGWLSIFHRDFLRIFDVSFCFAFDAVSLYHITSRNPIGH
jgi:hypothetical protein